MAGGGGVTITGAGGGLGERGVGVGEAVASVGAGGGVPGFFSGLDWTWKERGGRSCVGTGERHAWGWFPVVVILHLVIATLLIYNNFEFNRRVLLIWCVLFFHIVCGSDHNQKCRKKYTTCKKHQRLCLPDDAYYPHQSSLLHCISNISWRHIAAWTGTEYFPSDCRQDTTSLYEDKEPM